MGSTSGEETTNQSDDPLFEFLFDIIRQIRPLAWREFRKTIEERGLTKQCDEQFLSDQFDIYFSTWWKQMFLPQINSLLQTPEIIQKATDIVKDPNRAMNEHWSKIESTVDSLKTKNALPEWLSAEDCVGDILSQTTLKPLPPGHPLLRILGVENEGEWNNLSAEKKRDKLFGMWSDKQRRHKFNHYAAKMIHNSATDSARVSISPTRTDHVSDDTMTRRADEYSARFIRELEAKDEIDRLVERIHLTPVERIILTGLRRGLKGTELEDYVLRQPGEIPQRQSIPVLANRVREKLKRAAMES